MAIRTAAAALGWWVLSEGRVDGWTVGAATIACAVAVSLWLAPPRAPVAGRLGAALRFGAYFLVQSLSAGAQVAWLALSPRARPVPAGIGITLGLPPGPPRYLLAGTLSLLPGTLSVRLVDAHLVVHALTGVTQIEDDVRALEARIAPLFETPS
ncbi:MAG: Na+/H+ antiporter subunit E [Gammaproteobacteria bacterium]